MYIAIFVFCVWVMAFAITHFLNHRSWLIRSLDVTITIIFAIIALAALTSIPSFLALSAASG